jgi:phosphate-selective porin OprO/OprP
VQVDYWTFDADEDFEAAIGDEWNTGLFVRRARLGVDMTILENTSMRIEYDFARGGANQNGITDAYVAVKDLQDCGVNVPDVYVGHFREPFTLEELTSNKYTTFIERALTGLAFAPGRNTGLMLQDTYASSRLLLQAGVFHAFSNSWGDGIFSDDGPSEFDGDQDGWATTGRAVYVPWYDCSCPDCRNLHLGAAVSYRTDLRPDNLRFRTRPEVGFGPRVVDTGPDVVAEDLLMLGAEVAFVYDRFAVQGEYVMVDVGAPTQGDPVYWGFYAEASYWLTGECRNYERGQGRFGRVKVCRPFFCDECRGMGPGGWQVAARFSYLDLNDGDVAVRGGEVWDVTAGVNWHVNNHVRVMFNYVHSEASDVPVGAGNVLNDGTVDAFGVRVQAEF